MKKLIKIVKGLLKSKTFYFNLISGILAFVNEATGKIIDEQTAIIIITIGNIILRMITNKPLTEK